MKIKRLLLLLLCMTIWLVSGCESTETIPLTRENIESYLHITADVSDGVTHENTKSYYGTGVVEIEVMPCSNAKFENVTIEMKLALDPYTKGRKWQFSNGGYYTTSWEDCAEEAHVKDVTMTISYDGNGLIQEDVYLDLSKIDWYKDTEEWNIFGFSPDNCYVYYEIVYITGDVIVEK